VLFFISYTVNGTLAILIFRINGDAISYSLSVVFFYSLPLFLRGTCFVFEVPSASCPAGLGYSIGSSWYSFLICFVGVVPVKLLAALLEELYLYMCTFMRYYLVFFS
jgi:hypothetical protein